MYVELIRPCRDAGKQGAWHGNAAQVWECHSGLPLEWEPGHACDFLNAQLSLRSRSTDFFFFFVKCVYQNKKKIPLCKTNVTQCLKSQTSYMELENPQPGPIKPFSHHIYLPLNILGCRSIADHKLLLKDKS